MTTDPVTAITTTSAVSGGIVTGNDSTPLTARGLQWATDSNFTNLQIADANSAVNFSATMSPLSPGTTYYARAFATNAGGTGYGNTVEFTTNAASSDYTVSTYATFPDSTDLPMGVAAGPAGILYACGNGGQVWTIAANGSVGLLTDLGMELRDIVADARGNCYVLTQVGDIRRITPAV
ncbi:MAG TPA: hypothetical protein VGS79_19930 [Puia sp.]|nr:hypothetical protein [Puia sp.]